MKKILSIILSFAFIISITSPFYANASNTSPSGDYLYYVEIEDEFGNKETIYIEDDTQTEIPIFQRPEGGKQRNGLEEVATLIMQRVGDVVMWQFVPTFLYNSRSIGLSGSWSVTNYSGLDMGTYRYTGNMGDSRTAAYSCNSILTGTYNVIGMVPVKIIQGRHHAY